jgi:hypothetical protein
MPADERRSPSPSRACVDSYWTWRRSPDSVKALIDAGATAGGITWPSGYDEVDRLLHCFFTDGTET